MKEAIQFSLNVLLPFILIIPNSDDHRNFAISDDE